MSDPPISDPTEAWLAHARAVTAYASRPYDDQLFLLLFQLLQSAPGALTQQFRLTEQSLVESRLEAAKTRLEEGSWRIDSLAASKAPNALECLLDVIVGVRAVDELRASTATSPTNNAIYCPLPREWRADASPAWLLRRRRPRTAVVQDQWVMPYWAMVHHRFLPKVTRDRRTIDVLECDAALNEALGKAVDPNGDLACFAGIFDDGGDTAFDLRERATEATKDFVVTGITKDKKDGMAHRASSAISHAKKASEQGAHILVLPEFTMPPGAQRELLDSVRRRAAAGESHPLLIVPGSFHMRKGDRVVNRAVLYDWNGIPWIEHDKNTLLAIRKDNFRYVENINVSGKITLLNTRVGVLGVAICLDFCEAMNDNPWSELEVDWVLVPSYSPPGPSTYNLHLQRAKALKARYGTTTVVAQQNHHEPRVFPGSGLVVTGNGEFSLGPGSKPGTFISNDVWGWALSVPAGAKPKPEKKETPLGSQ